MGWLKVNQGDKQVHLTPGMREVLTTMLSDPADRAWYGAEIVHQTGIRSYAIARSFAVLRDAGWVIDTWAEHGEGPASKRRYHQFTEKGRQSAAELVGSDQRGQKGETTVGESQQRKSVRGALEEWSRDTVTVDQIARKTGLTRMQVQAQMREITGKTKPSNGVVWYPTKPGKEWLRLRLQQSGGVPAPAEPEPGEPVTWSYDDARRALATSDAEVLTVLGTFDGGELLARDASGQLYTCEKARAR